MDLSCLVEFGLDLGLMISSSSASSSGGPSLARYIHFYLLYPISPVFYTKELTSAFHNPPPAGKCS